MKTAKNYEGTIRCFELMAAIGEHLLVSGRWNLQSSTIPFQQRSQVFSAAIIIEANYYCSKAVNMTNHPPLLLKVLIRVSSI